MRLETVALMPAQESSLTEYVARLAEFLTSSDVVRIRIERGSDVVEVSRRAPVAVASPARASTSGDGGTSETNAALALDSIKADLVGIFRLGRPAPFEGEVLDEDRELGYIEALGIRTPVHSMGGGRIVTIASHDGAPVEYGQPLFMVDRG